MKAIPAAAKYTSPLERVQVQPVDVTGLQKFMTRPLYAYTARLDQPGQDSPCQGFALDTCPERALQRTIGECLERHSAQYREDLSLHSVPPTSTCFTKARGDELLWSVGGQGRWVLARTLDGWGEASVSAAETYYGYQQQKDERVTCPYTTSTGVALHRTQAKALERAVLEVLERDAFVRARQSSVRELRRIPAADDLPGLTHVLMSQNQAYVTCTILQCPERQLAWLGLAARSSLQEACEASMMEALQSYLVIKAGSRYLPKRTPQAMSFQHTFMQESHYIQDWVRAPLLKEELPDLCSIDLTYLSGCWVDFPTGLPDLHCVKVFLDGTYDLDERQMTRHQLV